MTTAHNPLQSSGRDEAHLPCGEAVPRSTESPEVAVGAAEPLLLCAPAGLALGDVPTRQPIGIVLTVLGVVVLDFSADATEGPIRVYLLDVVDSEEQDMALNIHAFSAGEWPCPGSEPHPWIVESGGGCFMAPERLHVDPGSEAASRDPAGPGDWSEVGVVRGCWPEARTPCWPPPPFGQLSHPMGMWAPGWSVGRESRAAASFLTNSGSRKLLGWDSKPGLSCRALSLLLPFSE